MVAVDLEKGGKGSFREILSVIRTFARFRPHQIELEDGTRRTFDSLLFANITEMAKYATLSENGRARRRALRGGHCPPPHSAKLADPCRPRSRLPSGVGADSPPPRTTASSTLKPTLLQLDGELLTLNAGTPVQVDIAPKALATIS